MEAVFTFHSTHEAMTGERALIDGGVKVRVMALPSSLGAGCGLCLRVDQEELETSNRLFAEAGLQPEGVYLKRIEDGVTTYTVFPSTW